jgi:hypothetical protein
MQSVELDEFNIDVKGIDLEQLGSAFERLSSSAISTSRHIVDRMNGYRERQLERVDMIRSSL